MLEHETIWLQPWCDKCEREAAKNGNETGRMWCQDNVWDDCDECERRAVKYIIAIAKRKKVSGAH